MHDVSLFDIALGFLAVYYVLVNLALVAGIRRLRRCNSTEKPFVSVIVAARNEEKNIPGLLECLVHQDYPHYEIVIVNDRSSDRTRSMIEQYQSRYPDLRRIDVDSSTHDLPPKKHALAQGIEASKGEILVFTDADCLPPPSWVSALVRGFDDDIGLVAGYSPYHLRPHSDSSPEPFTSRILQEFIQYEEFKGATWSAGSIGLRRGWLCTGRSLAYRRCVYDEVGGFERIKHSVSGDDDLFLQIVRRFTTWEMNYVTEPGSHVPTYPPSSFSEFIEQRTRHFSAGKFFSLPMKLFFFFFHAANLIMFLSCVGAVVFGSCGILFWAFVAKMAFDSLLFVTAAPVFKETRFRLTFLFMEMLIICYNSFIGPLGMISRYEWKPEKNQ